MKHPAICCALLLLSVLFLGACATPTTAPDPLIVSVASDLTPAFQELGRAFEEETGIPVTFNFGSSGKLAQQIEEDASPRRAWTTALQTLTH